jgi:hypothetical protein
MQVNEQQRQLLIKEAAYFQAEKRGFAPGHEQADWLAAERHVDEMLNNMQQAAQVLQADQAAVNSARRNRKAASPESPAAKSKRRPRTGKALEQEKAAEGVVGIGLPESQIVEDYSAGGPLKKPSATPNPAVEAAKAVQKRK